MAFTVEALVTKAGVRNIDQECSDTDILSLANFCVPWNLVGQHLHLTGSQLSAIDGDCKSTELKRLGTLQKWRQTYSFKATYRRLVEALLSCGKADEALKVCKFLAQKEGTWTVVSVRVLASF